MEVSAKHEGQTLTFFLVGELDHHGAKGLLENLGLISCKDVQDPNIYKNFLPLDTFQSSNALISCKDVQL